MLSPAVRGAILLLVSNLPERRSDAPLADLNRSGSPTAEPGKTGPIQGIGRYVALGDSFTEGVGDPREDGSLRGWADLTAAQLAATGGGQGEDRFRYANLSIRGKLLGQIVDEQVDDALAMAPDLVTFAGGGNDILRPRCDIAGLLRLKEQVVARFVDRGIGVVLFTGADPSGHLPLGKVIRSHGDRFCEGVRAIAERRGARLVDLWSESELSDLRYWDTDRLHLNRFGHQQVAARVLAAVGHEAPAAWTEPAEPLPDTEHPLRQEADYYRGYVLPWVQRRLAGRSSGDELGPKRPVLQAYSGDQALAALL